MAHVPFIYASIPQTTLLITSRSFMLYCALWDLSYTLAPFSLVLREGSYWSTNSEYNLFFNSYMLCLFPKVVLPLYFHSDNFKVKISGGKTDWNWNWRLLQKRDLSVIVVKLAFTYINLYFYTRVYATTTPIYWSSKVFMPSMQFHP